MLMLRLLSFGVMGAGGLAAAFTITQLPIPSLGAKAAPDLSARSLDLAKPRMFLSEEARQDAAKAELLPPDTRSVLNLPSRMRYG
jgi:hypothetical protein